MKTYLSFNDRSEEDRENLKNMMQANAMKRALWDIGQEVFRPARKNGYPHPELNSLLEKDGVAEAIGLLEEKFYEILREWEVSVE